MVYTLGESLLDIIISSMDDVVIRPGGAMLNTAVSLGRSDVDVCLITEMGDDNTCQIITSFLQNNNVNTNFIQLYNTNNTSLALAFLDDDKKPSYTFIKNYPKKREFPHNPDFNENDILLFGSLYSLDKDIRGNILSYIVHAQERNAIVIYDPNIRNAQHLRDVELMKSVNENIRLSDIIKGSDEDFTNIFGTTGTSDQIAKLREINKQALIIITQGAKGVIVDLMGKSISLPAVDTMVKSTIGAGDAFNAGIIFALIQLNIKNYNPYDKLENNIESILTSGLNFSARVCSSFDNYIPKVTS